MEKESKDIRFKRVATKRVRRILHDLKLLGNCSNRRIYAWDDKQLKKIWNAIDKEYKLCKAQFSDNSNVRDFEL